MAGILVIFGVVNFFEIVCKTAINKPCFDLNDSDDDLHSF